MGNGSKDQNSKTFKACLTTSSTTTTTWELVKSEEPQTIPDLLRQNLHFNKIPGWLGGGHGWDALFWGKLVCKLEALRGTLLKKNNTRLIS